MKRIEEIGIKQARVHELMRKLDLKGVLLKTQANFCWFTGGGLNEVTIADTLGVTSILITKNERYIISNKIESARMLEDEGLSDLGFTLAEYEWFEGSEYKTVENILDPKKIGCDVAGFGYDCYENEIKELRYQLLQPEIDRYLWLGQKASLAVETVMSMVKPGMAECMLTGEVLRLLWYDRIDSVCNQSAADERSLKYRHPIATEKKVGKYLLLNVNARKWGLVTTITRSVYIGKMPEELRNQYAHTLSIECEMIAASTIGTPTKNIFQKTVGLYDTYGYPGEWRLHHQGGAQGYRNRDFLVFPNSEERVLENQCFCWNPSIAKQEYGTKSEDAFIATKEGPLMITVPLVFPKITMSFGGTDFVRPGILEL